LFVLFNVGDGIATYQIIEDKRKHRRERVSPSLVVFSPSNVPSARAARINAPAVKMSVDFVDWSAVVVAFVGIRLADHAAVIIVHVLFNGPSTAPGPSSLRLNP
jgi:hypothetical protein